jgi:hypothetical protein
MYLQGHWLVIEELTSLGAQLEQADRGRYTSMHLAVGRKVDLFVVQTPVRAGSSTESPNGQEYTPEILARPNNIEAACKFLL